MFKLCLRIYGTFLEVCGTQINTVKVHMCKKIKMPAVTLLHNFCIFIN